MLIWEEGLTISDTFCFACFGNWEGGDKEVRDAFREWT